MKKIVPLVIIISLLATVITITCMPRFHARRYTTLYTM
jgi:hypothetical protein